MFDQKNMGSKIVQARKKLHLSQAQLGEKLFISQQAIGKWERGESMPDIAMLNRLVEALGVPLSYFTETEQHAETSRNAETILADAAPPAWAAQTAKPAKWNMSGGNWVDADFSKLRNLKDQFSRSNIQNCLFVDSDLTGLLLQGNHITGCTFTGADLRNSTLSKSNIAKNKFEHCSFIDARFSSSEISHCNFERANFSGCEFLSSDFRNHLLIGAVWAHTVFKECSLSQLIFEGDITDCSFEQCSFSKVVFREATLRNTFFHCRSLKRIEFTQCKADALTLAFLKNAKADVTTIELLVE